MRDITELFATDPLSISLEEFEQKVLPYMRELRAKALIAEAKGEPAPRAKRQAPPPSLSLKDLQFKK